MSRKPKASKSDYTRSMLPHTRKEVFLDVLRLQWRSLFTLGLILLLFALPLVLSTVARDIYTANFGAELEKLNETAALEAGYALAYWEIGRNLLNIVFLTLLAVGVSGVCRVIRQYAWEENVHIPTDFVRGVKDNFPQTAALAVLSGLVYVLCLIVLYTSTSYGSDALSTVSMLPIGISVLLLIPVFSLCLTMIPVYSNRLTTSLKNAFIVYTQAPLQTLPVLLLCAVIWLPALIPNFYCHLLGSIAALLLMPFILLGWTLFCYEQFDRFINPTCCPDLIGKGIYVDK